MYPHERSLVNEKQDEPFALIGVNSDDLARAREAVAENELNWRSFQNSAGETPISSTWCVEGWPTVFVLDAERKIRYRGHDGDAATAVVEELLAAMKRDGE